MTANEPTQLDRTRLHCTTTATKQGARGRTAFGGMIPAALLSLALASGCQTIQVTHDWDPDADFAQLKTWQWSDKPKAPTGDVRIDGNTLLEGRVHTAVEAELAAKGFSKIASGKPDFLVVYHAAISEKLDIQTVNDYYGYDPAWGWGYQPTGWGTRTYVSEYDEGSLILDITLPNNHLIWRGTAAADVDDNKTPEQRAARIRASVAEMLKFFPPQQATETAAGVTETQ